MKNSLPFLSIVLPIKNEVNFIEKIILDLLNQNYPKDRFEIIIVDGLSNDGSLDILKKFEASFNNIFCFSNPITTTPTNLNIGIKQAKGDFIIRMDGHVEIDNNFFLENIRTMEEKKVAISGGPIIHEGSNNFAKGTAIAMSDSMGIGNANHRKIFNGYVEGVAFPCIKREVFEKIGFFDEDLIRCQDEEFNYRVKKAGYRIYQSSKIKSKVYVRNSTKKLFKQYYQYGFWKWLVFKKIKAVISVRQLVPSLFVIYLLLLPLVYFYISKFILIPIFTYFLLITFFILKNSYRFNIKIGFNSGLAIIIMHLAYGIGFLINVLKIHKILNLNNINRTISR